jgi:hypothetical protein
MRSDEPSIAEVRAEARRAAQTIFAAMAALALLCSLAFHFGLVGSGLAGEDSAVIARGFLFVAGLDTIMMFVWDHVVGHDH